MTEPSRDLKTEAIERFAKLRGGQSAPNDLDALRGWFDEHPAHRAAFDEVADHWTDMGALRDDPTMLAMRAEARRDLKRLQMRRVIMGSIAACLVALVVVGGFLTPKAYNHFAYVLARDHAPTFSTPVGQLATVTLPDGTLATLDTDTVLRAWQVRHGRYVELIKGRARFQVTKNPSKPFSVLAAGASVTALGTDFSVYLRPEGMSVTLVEGRLRVKGDTPGQAMSSVDMSAGYRLTANRRAWSLARTNAASDVSWTSRQLHFDESTLQEIADELNRYSDTKIVIPDRSVRDLRMTAVINSTDRQSFLDAVNTLSLARVRQVGNTFELLSRQKTAG